MAEIFNAYEIFEIAEQIERNGGKFYRKAAAIAKTEDGKKFLTHLAEMEDEHESFFGKLKEKFGLDSGGEFPDFDNQMLGYLQSMAAEKVFGNTDDPSDTIDPESHIEDIIKIAIEFEKNTIVYFSSVKEAVPPEFGKDKIDALIREEISHIALLVSKQHELRLIKKEQNG